MTIYIVTVKLISSVDLLNAVEIEGMVGKYMLAVSGLNMPAKEMRPTMNHFSVVVKTLNSRDSMQSSCVNMPVSVLASVSLSIAFVFSSK